MSLFTDEEINEIEDEYSLKHNLNDSGDSSLFTEHSLNSTLNNENVKDESKSIILAPFNTIKQSQDCSIEYIGNSIKGIFIDSIEKNIIKFKPKLREFDRKYERDNKIGRAHV